MDQNNTRNTINSVNGISLPHAVDPSLGTRVHVQQVTLDRNPTTAQKKRMLTIGTWNVRTLHQDGKLDNIKLEMERLKVNILGMSEVRWKGAGTFQSDNFKLVFSGGEKHERGVGVLLDRLSSHNLLGFWAISDRVLLVKLKGQPMNFAIIQVYAPTAESTDEESDKFYEDLDKAKEQCKSGEVIMVIGDLNAKVGEGKQDNIVGAYGLGTRNERGEKFVDWCRANDQIITNTWFRDHCRRRWTWSSPDNNTRNQIDYITIHNRFRNAIKQSKSYPGGDCGSDHIPVICKLRLKLRKLQKPKTSPQIDFDQLRDETIKSKYAVAVKNRFDVLEQEEGKTTWEIFKESFVESANKIIPLKKRLSKNSWMTDDILNMMRERQKATRNSTNYKNLNKEIKMKCKDAKEIWLNQQCEQIEIQNAKEPKSMPCTKKSGD